MSDGYVLENVLTELREGVRSLGDERGRGGEMKKKEWTPLLSAEAENGTIMVSADEPNPLRGCGMFRFPLEAKKEHAMKKTMLALACAAVCVAGAEDINSVDFENYTGSKLMSNGYDDFGNQNSSKAYFTYDTSNGSEDGSTVVAHDKEDAPTGWTEKAFGSKYLALSTEGGTLWRSIKEAVQETETGKWDAITPQEVPADTGLYIDTMVQFTPTEDGSALEIGKDAKLAIWLNVATADDGTATTNLCVRGSNYEVGFTPISTNFTLVTETGENPDIRPGEWCRLTVKALVVYQDEESGLFGFQIKLNGGDLKLAAGSPYANIMDMLSGIELAEDVNSLITAGKIVPILGNSVSLFELSAVGFKGSGAIDDFLVTTTAPSYETSVTSVDFTLTWGEGVSSVTYTIEGETKTATKDARITVDPTKTVTVAATPADWYKITGGPGEFSVTENTTQTITAELDSLANLGISGFDSSVSTTDVKEWAGPGPKGHDIPLSELKNNSYAYNSFLLNTDLLTTDPVLTIDDVTVADGKMTITVAAKTSSAEDASAINLEDIYGVLYVKTGDTLDDMKSTEVPFIVKQGDNKNEDGKLTVTLDAGKFAQVKIGAKPQSAE